MAGSSYRDLMDLDAYFHRIGYAGPRAPSLEVLREVVLAHATTVPFENLDILLGRGISLDDAAVERKLVHDRRGGYCFEQNSLLLRVLTALGFAAVPLSARVRLNQPPDAIPPRTHLFLRVEIDGVPWLADVGLGGTAPTAPVRLDLLGAPQPTPHGIRRVSRDEASPFPRYFYQFENAGAWHNATEFTGEQMPPIDRDLANWWTSACPESRFRQNLLVGLAGPNGERLGITNREFTRRRGAEVLEQFVIENAEQLLAVLAERFGLVFPPGTRFQAEGLGW